MSTKVYIGNIPETTTEDELKDKFKEHGVIESVWLARNPPGFAFITFEDPRDADDAIRQMDGRDFLGRKIRVEMSRSRTSGAGGARPRRRSPSPRARSRSRSVTPPRRSRTRGRSPSRSRSASRSKRQKPSYGNGGAASSRYKQGEFRVRILGLSSRASWQDLKDFLRKGGEVCYADVRDGEGVADFLTLKDMERAMRKLDGTEFMGKSIEIKEYSARRSRSRSRSRSVSSKSSRSPARRSRSRS